MNGLHLDDTLKMTNLTQLTDKRVKKIKDSELEELLQDIPEGYKKAIVSCLKVIYTERKKGVIKEKRLDLAQLIEQVVWIKTQKKVEAEL